MGAASLRPASGRAAARRETPAALRLPSGAPRADPDAPSALDATDRMPPGSAAHRHHDPNAHHAFTVTENGQHLGVVVLVLTQRPSGSTLRRNWWAHAPANDPRPIPRPFTTRRDAVSCLRYRHATLNPPAASAAPVDATLQTIAAAHSNAGPTAAVWLAASLTLHHISELEARRSS